jgi:pheromone shutdown protein TraB
VQNVPYAQRRDSLRAAYRFMNADDYPRADVDAQWRFFLRAPFPDSPGQTRLALWEVRNLNMVSNIRRAAAQVPGGRVLVIVGASHRAFFDAYLRAMTNVRVVDSEHAWRRAP